MAYQIDYLINEWWDTFATTRYETWAQEIADMLLSQGKTVRISEVTTNIELGETQEPQTIKLEE